MTSSSSSSSEDGSSSGTDGDSESEDSDNGNSTYEWERKRGRASGSSQRFSLAESSSHSLPPTTGRRYTFDVSQWTYNESWSKKIDQSSVRPEIPPKGLDHKGNFSLNCCELEMFQRSM
jgi:hypothetical protein